MIHKNERDLIEALYKCDIYVTMPKNNKSKIRSAFQQPLTSQNKVFIPCAN